MIFSQIEEASGSDVREWILESIPDLTKYQKEVIQNADCDIIRVSHLHFYIDKSPQKVSFLWRFTILIFPLVWLVLFIGLPFNMLFTGRWGYGKKLTDRILTPWVRRLNLM